MLMVVFGAGASYDSYSTHRPPSKKEIVRSDSNQARPPLAADLFDDRPMFADVARHFPECKSIIPFLRHPRAKMTVEQILEELRKEADQNPRRLVQLAAVRHYLQMIITRSEARWEEIHTGITNYCTLLDEIESWRIKTSQEVCLVTFNYDTMIERALPEVRIKIDAFSDYIAHPYKLFKLHGSANWAREVHRPMLMQGRSDWDIARQLIAEAHSIHPSNDFTFATSSPIGRSDRFPLVPAVAIPIVEKQQYECPPQHLNALDACLPKVARFLIIGWRANEKHFLKKLSEFVKKPLRGMVVSGNVKGAEETISNLSSISLTVPGGYTRFGDGFSEFITRRSVRNFLASPDAI